MLETSFDTAKPRPKKSTEKDYEAVVSIAQLITDYLTESQDKCGRCEVQQAMDLTQRVEENRGLSEEDRVKQLQAVAEIYQTIGEYVGL